MNRRSPQSEVYSVDGAFLRCDSPSTSKFPCPSESDMTFDADDGFQSAWRILGAGSDGTVSSQKFIRMLAKDGILTMSDPRLKEVSDGLYAVDGVNKDVDLNFDQFYSIAHGSINFIGRILEGKLKIPDFEDFVLKLEIIFNKIAKVKDGANASYIPVLAEVDPNMFGMSVCSVDGQRWSIGDCEEPFSIQSCTKPIQYLMALQENGDEKVHYHVGTEPSGEQFNKLVLKAYGKTNPNKHGHQKERKIPHNPMINAGAIMCCSLIMSNWSMADRFNKVMTTWRKLCGSRIGFGNIVYLSEKATADRNWCLGYMMQEYSAFPTGTKLDRTLDFYFQCCSMEANCGQMAILASTLANGGMSPLSGERIFDPKHVRNCLSIMLTSGMYDYSGEWAFRVGLPAKSGVGGCVYIVVPNVLGIAIWSPPLDENGNSVKGILIAKELTSVFNFHHFDHLKASLCDKKRKNDPTLRTRQTHRKNTQAMLYAAANGDVKEMERLQYQGVDLFVKDYDARSSLHLACSEGHHRVVEYLVEKTEHLSKMEKVARLSPLDRWNRTPLDDAWSSDQPACIKILEKANAQRGTRQSSKGSFRVLNLGKQNSPYYGSKKSESSIKSLGELSKLDIKNELLDSRASYQTALSKRRSGDVTKKSSVLKEQDDGKRSSNSSSEKITKKTSSLKQTSSNSGEKKQIQSQGHIENFWAQDDAPGLARRKSWLYVDAGTKTNKQRTNKEPGARRTSVQNPEVVDDDDSSFTNSDSNSESKYVENDSLGTTPLVIPNKKREGEEL